MGSDEMWGAVPSHPQNAGDLEPPEGELAAFTGRLVS